MPNTVHVELPAHEAPNMRDSFLTRYNYDYNIDLPLVGSNKQSERDSGHRLNRPLFERPLALEDTMTSVSHKKFQKYPSDLPSPTEARVLTQLASLGGRDLTTAHVRMRFHPGAPWNEDPTTSTFHDHYPPKWTATSNIGHVYGGHAPTAFDKKFLHTESRTDFGVGVTKTKMVLLSRGETIRPATEFGPPSKRPQDHLTVFAQRQDDLWVPFSKSYGDRSLYRPQLLPKGVSDCSDKHVVTAMDNKKGLLETLAGAKKLQSQLVFSSFETNPIPMKRHEMDQCHVGKRVELVGNVKDTTYQSSFTKQSLLPELHDPPRDKPTSIKFNKHPRKEGPTHPSVLRRLQATQTALSIDKTDPHAHKKR